MFSINARPERIFGNVALASLTVGTPIGIAFSIAYLVSGSEGATLAGASKEIAACVFGPILLLLLAGSVGLGIPLWLLRRLGFAGPAIAFAFCAATGLVIAADISRPGVALGVIATALIGGAAFCRFAYSTEASDLGSDSTA